MGGKLGELRNNYEFTGVIQETNDEAVVMEVGKKWGNLKSCFLYDLIIT